LRAGLGAYLCKDVVDQGDVDESDRVQLALQHTRFKRSVSLGIGAAMMHLHTTASRSATA